MAISNEDLVKLYKSTESKSGKETIYKELSTRLEDGAMKMCHFWVKFAPAYEREETLEDYIQIARYTLCKSIWSYNPEKGAAFITFYYNCVRNELHDYIKLDSKRLDNEFLVERDIKSYKKEQCFDSSEETLDNKYLRDKLELYIDKINFKKDIYKDIFLENIGFKQKNNICASYTDISKKYSYTKGDEVVKYSVMAIKKICDRSLAQLQKYIVESGEYDNLEEFRYIV